MKNYGKTDINLFKEGEILVFLFILLFLVINIILIFFSKIQIQINNLKISTGEKRHINKNYEIIIKLYTLKKIPILKSVITKEKLEKNKLKEKIQKIDFDKIKNQNEYNKKAISALKKIDINIKKIDLNMFLGTENATITALIIPVISTIISIFLRRKVKDYNNQKYVINPVYLNRNILNISLSGIFEFKLWNIIIIIINILNKNKKSLENSYNLSYVKT